MCHIGRQQGASTAPKGIAMTATPAQLPGTGPAPRPPAAPAEASPAPRPLLDRWFEAWAARAEARWRAHADLRSRYY